MKKYQIVETGVKDNNAGPKATADIAVVADSLGFERCTIALDLRGRSALSKLRRQVQYKRYFNKAYADIAEHSVVLLQHPFHHKQLTREETLRKLRSEKQVNFISVVHDVESLRGYRDSDYYREEYRTMIELADVIIVHNNSMYEWFISQGFSADKLVVLGIFDYLHKHPYTAPSFERAVNIAGNLDAEKCKYIAGLNEIKGVDIYLYGSNYNAEGVSDNIHYQGSFPVDEIPSKLNKGFGLVWDGEGIDGCIGQTGQYLKYNNPHKLSLYLSSGIPVIIWDEAAEASFVKENNVGITVSSLKCLEDALNSITEEDYRVMADNVKTIREKLISGEYAKNALNEALSRIGKETE